MGCHTPGGLLLLAVLRLFGLHHDVLAAILRNHIAVHGRKLDIVPNGGQHGSSGQRTVHGSNGTLLGENRVSSCYLSASAQRVYRLGMRIHRGGLCVARRLGVLLDEFATSLGVARGEGRGAEHVERLLTLHAGAIVDIGRSWGKAVKAGSEERRHGGYRREKENQFRTGKVDGWKLEQIQELRVSH